MIQITDDIIINKDEIHEEFICADGPGGQNVNKVATAVLIRFNTRKLPEDVRERLVKIAGSKLTEKGILYIKAKRYRSQFRNRKDAIDRLIMLIRKAAVKPRIRRKTKAPAGSKRKRLENKRKRCDYSRVGKLPRNSDE